MVTGATTVWAASRSVDHADSRRSLLQTGVGGVLGVLVVTGEAGTVGVTLGEAGVEQAHSVTARTVTTPDRRTP
jgi:hypothetical protein